jgi:integrase-like protein
MPSGAAIVRYDGKRGVVWRIKRRDADGAQVQETIGTERDGITRKQAQEALTDRLSDVRRRGHRRPKQLTFGDSAETWFEEGKRSQGWKPRTIGVYRNALDRYLIPAFGSTRP